MNKKIPLLKEYRLSKLRECLKCIDENPFNREKQRNCILRLYPQNPKGLEHMEKSIFRGMIIPSLRQLGLLIGYGDSIRLAANGKLIIESEQISSDMYNRVLRVVLLEIDQDVFQFLEFIKKEKIVQTTKFIVNMSNLIEGSSMKQKKERITKWISILEQAELIEPHKHEMNVNKERFDQTISDMQQIKKCTKIFRDYFFQTYRELSKNSAGIVDIKTCRESVSMKMLNNDRIILTEKKFDEMLRDVPRETSGYIISFGKPMGAKEKLFNYGNEYFGTILIRFLKKFNGTIRR